MNILLFGAGDYGRKYLKLVERRKDISVSAFLDNNPNIIGTKIEGVGVLSVAQIENHYYYQK